jgi:hypothetical protein
MSFGSAGKPSGSPMEIYASFVKVYWIVLTIDQHPQKPLLQDAGQTYQELEQYENLIAVRKSFLFCRHAIFLQLILSIWMI